MAKKQKSSILEMGKASTSRYASPPVTLRIGAGLQPFYVPEVLLQSLHDLPRLDSTEKTIALQDVDAGTGHVIVHFLYTGQYQTLPDDDDDEGMTSNSGRADFNKAIAVFMAAKKYGLTDLQELARNEVVQCGDRISLVHAAHALGKGTLAALQEDADWLQDLVLRKADGVFKESEEIFSSPNFFSGIKNLRMAKMLGQHVAKLYHDNLTELYQALAELEAAVARQGELLRASSGLENTAVPLTPSDHHTFDEDTVAPPPEVDILVNDSDDILRTRTVEETHVSGNGSALTTSLIKEVEPTLKADAKLASLEPTVEATEHAVIEETVVEQPLAEGDLVEEAPVEATPAEDPPAEATQVDEPPAEEPLVDIFAVFKKKGKKKLQNKMKRKAAAKEMEEMERVQASIVAAETECLEEEEHRRSSDAVDKTTVLDRANAMASQDDCPENIEVSGSWPEPVPEVVPEAEVAPEPELASPQEQPSEMPAEPLWVTEEPPVLPEPPTTSPKELTWDPWFPLGSSSKKSRKKKKSKTVQIDCPPPSSPPPPEPDMIFDQDLIEPEPQSVPEPATPPVQEELHSLAACPWRYEHLTQDAGWRTCKDCELYMRQVAVKLHTAGLPDVNGLMAG